MKRVIDSLLNKLSRWDWDDTWSCLGFAVLTTLSIGIFYGVGMHIFFGGENLGYYIDTYSYYEKTASRKYVVLDSTTMQRNKIIVFYVKANLRFSDDPILLLTRSANEAQDLFFKLTSQKISQNLRTQNIASLYESLPFDEKINFLTQIKMLKVGSND